MSALSMRVPFLLAAVTLAATLPAQGGRGRFRPGGGQPRQQPPAEQPAPPADQKPKTHLAIVGGDVYLGTGQRITGATVLVGDSRIVAVGHNLDLPEGTTILDAKGKTVAPGFVAVVGFGMGAGRNAPFADSVNPFDPEIKQALAAGVTAFLANAPGGGSTPSGETAVIKLAWGDPAGMVLREGTVYGMSAELSLADRQHFVDLVAKAKEHQKALAAFQQQHQQAQPAGRGESPRDGGARPQGGEAKPPQAPPGTEKILDVLSGKARLWLQLGGGGMNPFGGGRRGGGSGSSDLAAIQDALEFARLLGTGVVLNKPTSAWLCPDEIGSTGSMVVWSPRDRRPADPADPDRTGTNLATGALLAAAGVPVAVTQPTGMFGGGAGVGTGGILGQDLNTPFVDAAFAVRGGLDDRAALRTITLDAARILAVDDRIGSLEPGKDADILILDGDPLHYRTFVETALVNGKVVYEKAKEPLYSHIQRGTPPR